jgi:hypothetical protein
VLGQEVAMREVAELLGGGQTSDLLEEVLRFTLDLGPDEPLPEFLKELTPVGS